MTIFSVGHSNQTMERFVGLLKGHDIQVIVDVRSHPFSKYSTQFDHDVIKQALENSGIKYLYLGKELGGMLKDDIYYDGDGNLNYEKLDCCRRQSQLPKHCFVHSGELQCQKNSETMLA